MFKEILCDIFGHKLRYNFTTLPNKCICKRCGVKWQSRYNGTWIVTTRFSPELGTDKEIKKRWHKNLNY
jgi:hypothetical protein